MLAHATEVGFASRRSLATRPVRWHGHILVDAVTLRARTSDETVFLSCDRDDARVVHDVELTFR